MAQHDYNLANQSRTSFRSDLNSALSAVLSRNSGSSAPTTTTAYMQWLDTTTATAKRRNAADSAWIVEGTLDEAFMLARTSNTILDVSDFGKSIIATSTFTQTLDAAATLGDGWNCRYYNAGTGVITIDPNSTEQINGATTLELYPGEGGVIVCNGTSFRLIGNVAAGTFVAGSFTRDVSTATGTQAVTGVGFKPRGIFFVAAISATVQSSTGMDYDTAAVCTYTNQGGTADNFGVTASSSVIIEQGGGNSYNGRIDTFDADGFTMTWTKVGSPTGTATINYLAMR